jgi:hypothetical protein
MKKTLFSLIVGISFLFGQYSTSTITKNSIATKDGNDSFAVVLKLGTLGLGMDFEYIHNSFLGLRANINGFSYQGSGFLEENEYNFLIDLKTAGLLVDYHPWQNAFRLSLGMYNNLTKVDATIKPSTGEMVIGDHVYESRQIGDIYTNILLNKTNPYLGLGFSSTDTKGVHMTLDVGVLYIGSPKAKMTAKAAKGYEGLQDILDKEVEIEEKNINEDIAKYKYYPVVSVGMQYKF